MLTLLSELWCALSGGHRTMAGTGCCIYCGPVR